ncbi:hypothetical protein ACQ3I4_11545 [Zafaria sp. Z1313]
MTHYIYAIPEEPLNGERRFVKRSPHERRGRWSRYDAATDAWIPDRKKL